MKKNAIPNLSWSAKRLLLATSALTLALYPSVASAQTAGTDPEGEQQTEAPAEEEREIIVTGIRGALESAKEIKRNASTFVDSLSASDIATLPDLSVAEALGRIPGVTISRFPTGGASPDFPSPEGRGNLVRGLSFVRSEFNGRDAFSANGGRSLDFSSIPPELIGGVDVYKNQSADLIEGGIGGTINLRTLEPFDRPGGLLVVAGDVTYSDLRKEWSPQISVTGGNRWSTPIGDVGFVASYSRSKLDSRINGWQQNAPMPRVLDANGNVPESLLTGANKLSEFDGVDASNIVGITPGFQLRTNDVDRDRESYYFAGQWKNDRLQLTAKYIRAENTIDSIERTFEWFPEHDTGTRAGVRDLVLDTGWGSAGTAMCSGPGGFPNNPGDCETLIPIGGGLMKSGFVTSRIDDYTGAIGSPVGSLGIGKIEEATTEDYSLNLKWDASDRLKVTLDGQYTKASARQRQIWGGMNTYLDWQIQHDLDNPQIQFFVNPATGFNGNQTRFTGDNDDPSTPGVVEGVRIPQATSTGDLNGSTWQFVADQFQEGTGELYALRADFDYDVSGGDGLASWFDSVKFGARYSERSQVNSEMALNWGSMAPAWDGRGGFAVAGTMQDPAAGFEAVPFGDFFRGGVVNGSNNEFVFVNENLLSSYENFRNYIAGEPQLGNNYGWVPRGETDGSRFGRATFRPEDTSDIDEKTWNAYARIDFKQEFDNGMSLDGNFGVRYVKTTLTSNGFQAFRPFVADIQTLPVTNGVRTRTDDAESRDDIADFAPEAVAYAAQAAVPTSINQSDERWLPSFNLKWNLNREMLLRFAYSKGLSRPNVQDLRSSQEYVVTTNRLSFDPLPETDPLFGIDRGAQNISVGEIRVSRGNPFLKPTTADSFDASYEWYFPGGYLSVSGFYKDLSNIITNGDLPLGSTTLDGQQVNIIYNGPVNQATATIKGVEIGYQQFFDFLPGVLKNFGVQANYTYIDASTTPPANGVDADGDGNPDDLTTVFRFGVDDLLGQSKHIANAVAIYQNKVVEARLAYNWRSEYLTTYRDYVTGNPIYNSAAGFLDASLKFNIGQFQIRGSIANILDTKSKARSYIDESGQLYDRFSFLNDRRIVLGALWRM
ncbi:TonB-dependent receptor [Sphingomonas sp. S1-29]|uniref:TonB-dependent receptor n=1 Tax=Sphingomonas sp. S1-29 TaxID=2991074 RepID=UPI0022406DD3|nr:TonB-dependent receptor [Sphingomonas sp. S1-29]UZK69793.1 TonB-dependent receptor [Sphingomonas sp. S1-29]